MNAGNAAAEVKIGPRSSLFGSLLMQHRLTAKLSQEALAERAGMSVDGISALERGIRRTPRFDTIALLVEALDLAGEPRRQFEAAARPVLSQVVAGTAMSSAMPSLDAVLSPPNNLPLALTRLVGREHELAAVESLVRDHRLVTLIGAGGIGKTRLALHTATALRAAADGGVWFIELAPITDPAFVATAIAATLGIRESPSRPLLDTLLAALKERTLLLILDNCEHVITQAASVVESLLRGCSGVRILATCREPLRVEGEHTFRLPSLEAPLPGPGGPLSAADAAGFAAIALFVERARAIDHRFLLTDENAPAIAEICRRLDGIPLAIELAAARVGVLPVDALARKLDERFRILTGGSRTTLPRQQTLRALIDWSFALLNERERACFVALSVFAGRFSLEAAVHVCDLAGEDEWTVLDLVGNLTSKSLLMRDPESDTFRQLETTRYYARDTARDAGIAQALARRHADYYFAFVKHLASLFGTTNGRGWQAEVRAILDDVRGALQWSIDQKNDVAGGIALVATFCDAWMSLGLDLECKERVDAALRGCDETTPPALRGRLHLARAQIGIRSQRASIEPAQAAVAAFASTADARGHAAALNVLGYALSREGRCDEADSYFASALSIARRDDDVRQAGLALLNLGVNRETADDFVKTREYYEAALALGTDRHDDYLIGAANLDLSVLCEAVDAPQAGFEHARHALEAFERAGDTNGSALALGNMTTNLIGLGRMPEARTAARDYVMHACAYRLDAIFIVALEKVAAIAESAGEAQAGAKLLGFTSARATALGLKRDPGNVRFTEGVLRRLEEKLGADIAPYLEAGQTLSEAAVADVALRVVSTSDHSTTVGTGLS